MKWLLALVLFAGQSCLSFAQLVSANATVSAAAPAFELEIQAPDEIRSLLERHLELPRYRQLTDMNDAELARLLVIARQSSQDLLATLGYFSPDIGIGQATTPGESSLRRVTLRVAPGEPTLVAAVQIEFTGPMASDSSALAQRQLIEASWLLRAGMHFTQAGWDSAKQQAVQQLTQQRYPVGKISTSLADIDPLQHSARLSVKLESGPAYRLGALSISGTQRFDNELLIRLARLSPGADYQQVELVQAQQRLTDSGFFDSAYIALDTTGDPQAAAVQVQVHESLLQKVVLGIGASTDSGARLSAEHTHHKVPGIGWRAVSKLMLDRTTHSIGTELTAPPDADGWRWVGSALLQDQQTGSADVSSQRLRAGRSQSGQRIDRNYYLQYDRARTTDSVVVTAQALSANYAFTLRNFDSLPFPGSGWGLGVEVGGGATLGSQQDPYARVLARGLAYQALGASSDTVQGRLRSGRLAWRAELGAVVAKSDVALPSTQLFLTGGDNSVRGYAYHELGVTQSSGQTSAGRYLGLASVEWQRPILNAGQVTDWESTLFVDAGAVADKAADLRAKLGLGVGARWKSAVGPLQMDLAYGVAVQRFRLHLNLGFSF